MIRRCMVAFALGLIAAAMAACAGPRLTLFGGQPRLQASALSAASPKPVCTPEMASPVDPVPLPTDPAYAGFLIVAPITAAEKAGFEVVRRFVSDVLADDQAKTARLRRGAAYCGAK